jgi:hypothetical protein
MFANCYPEWYPGECPYGVDVGIGGFGLTTFPNADRLSPTTAYVNVCFSFMPIIFFVYCLMYLLYLVTCSGEKPTTDHRNSFVYMVKYILISVFLLLLAEIEKTFIPWKRPSFSCMHSCGGPDGVDQWAVALCSLKFIDYTMRWTRPHLTHSLGIYSETQMDEMGYKLLGTGPYIKRILALMFFVVPIPFARIILGDATSLQVYFGCFQGFAFACLFHTCYIKLLKSRHGPRVYRWMGYALAFLANFRLKLFEGHWPCEACKAANQSMVLLSQQMSEALLLTSFADAPATGARMNNRRSNQRANYTWVPSGFEFITVDIDAELADMAQEKDEVRRELATAKEQVQIINFQNQGAKAALASAREEVKAARASEGAAIKDRFKWTHGEGQHLVSISSDDPVFKNLQELLDVTVKKSTAPGGNWTRDRGAKCCQDPSGVCKPVPGPGYTCPKGSEPFRNRDARNEVPVGYRLVKAFRNENPEIFKYYRVKEIELDHTCETKKQPVGPDLEERLRQLHANGSIVAKDAIWLQLNKRCNEVRLFHGTSWEISKAVCRANFRKKFQGKGHTMEDRLPLYGSGFYFTDQVTKADEYAGLYLDDTYKAQGRDGVFCLLVCRCNLGRVRHVIKKDISEADKQEYDQSLDNGEYDSVLGDGFIRKETFREITAPREMQIYPEFILCYQRLWQS